MAKVKLKLTKDQKRWASNLQWYIQEKILWANSIEERSCKEAVLDGKYAIFYMIGGAPVKYFDCVSCANDLESALLMCKYNMYSYYRIVDLNTLWIEYEANKLHKPTFETLKEKFEYDVKIERYKELKKQFKPILKYFKN